jgi:transposase
MPIAYLGIDVSKAKLDACLLIDSGKLKHTVVSNDPEGFEKLIQWLTQNNVPILGEIHACMEATAHYSQAIAHFLVERGCTVSVVNPAAVRAFARCELARGKSDKADAGRIARYCQMHKPRAWKPPTKETETLLALVHRIEALEQIQRMELNRQESASEVVQGSLSTILKAVEDEIKRLRKTLREFIEKSDILRERRDLLRSIPGIGDRSTLVLLAELSRADYLQTARQAAAFAGLVPRIHESGSSVRGRSCLSKQGCQRLRKALYFPAVVAMSRNPILKAFAERLLKAGKAKMLVLGAVMRKLLQMAFGVLKSKRKFDPNFGAT